MKDLSQSTKHVLHQPWKLKRKDNLFLSNFAQKEEDFVVHNSKGLFWLHFTTDSLKCCLACFSWLALVLPPFAKNMNLLVFDKWFEKLLCHKLRLFFVLDSIHERNKSAFEWIFASTMQWFKWNDEQNNCPLSDSHSKGWGLSAKLGKHSAIWGKLGTALQAYVLNPCTKFPPNPTS